MAEHEVQLLEKAMPMAVKQLDEVKSKLTEAQLMLVLDSLLHTHIGLRYISNAKRTGTLHLL